MKRAPAIRVTRGGRDLPRAERDATRADRAPGRSSRGTPQNVASLERVLSVVGGSALAVSGIRRRGLGGAALAVLGGVLLHRGATGHCFVYASLGIGNRSEVPWLRKQHGGAAVLEASEAVRVEDTITILAPVSALYDYWRDPTHLLDVMRHLQGGMSAADAESEPRDGDGQGAAPGLTVEIINDIPDRLVAWTTDARAAIPSAGSVHFDPGAGGRSTEVRIILEYLPPGGPFGALLLRLINGDPAPRLRRDLSRFRALMERRHSGSSARPRSR